jgi:transitional endoplasmic reticulum ATPase
MNLFDQRLAIEMAERMLIAIRKRSMKAVLSFSEFFVEHSDDLELGIDKPDEDSSWETSQRDGLLSDIQQAVTARKAALSRVRSDGIVKRLALVARVFGLSNDERDVLELLYRIQDDEVFEGLFDRAQSAFSWDTKRAHRVAIATGMPRRRVAEAMDKEGRLFQCGLMTVHHHAEASDIACEMLKTPGLSETGLVRFVVGKRLEAELEWPDFEHMARDRDRIAAILKGAVTKKAKAVHILLYGAPGTGKSQLARTIAAKLGVALHSVGEANACGEEMNRKEILSDYRVIQTLTASIRSSLLLVDEADDILGGSPWSPFEKKVRTAGSKAHLHRILETSGTPTIWTTNSIEWIDPAILRRMTYAIEVRRPGVESLARLWRRVTARRAVDMTPAQATKLAGSYPVAPGLVTSAIRLAELTGGGFEDLEAGVAAFSKAMGLDQQKAPPHVPLVAFDPALALADIDLPALCERLSGHGAAAVSFCLYGPPGTGKTAFARHLAATLRLKFVQKRASDLIDKYVGETEKRIAAAFREARDDGALLMFDEADSFLQDRSNAVRSWEVSEVNEMLTWMEDHPLPFICATNLMERLDPAALRRFVFKIRFDWLDAPRRAIAFQRFFGLEPPREIIQLERLTPGDFAVVARKARAMGWSSDRMRLAAMLAEEEAAKPGFRNALGFGIGR